MTSSMSFPARLRDSVMEASGWRRAGIAAGAGLLSVLAFAPFFFSPILFFTLPVLVWLIDSAEVDANPILRAAKNGWWFGFGFFFAGLFWIGEAFLVEAEKFAWALPFAITLMPAGLALFFAAAAAVTCALWQPGLARIIVLALALAVTEWLRGQIFTGFPWNVLGYALTFPLPLMQVAAFMGIYGLTLWAVLIFASPLVLTSDKASPWKPFSAALLAVLPLAAFALYGMLRLNSLPQDIYENVRVRIVQPSINQRDKWRPEKQREIFATHLDLSSKNPEGAEAGLKGITHLIWPEAAMPFLPLEHPEAIEAIGKLLPEGTHLYSGGLRRQSPESVPEGSRPHIYNSLLVFGPGGVVPAVYDKIHLVPFGEYLPFQNTLEAIGLRQLSEMRGGFSSGVRPRPLINIPGSPPISVLVCYEAIFPSTLVQGSERPGLFVNVTNDGWFGNTTGPRQHLQQARVRAVEEGITIVRAANNGISAVIAPDGRLLSSLGMNILGTIESPVPKPLEPPFYARYGDLMFLLNALIFLIASALLRRYKLSTT
jgi:apolipoprotein N-acyltransferase